jgi:hypothetical protein
MMREVNHSPLSSVEVKNDWRYTSAPLYCLHGLEREKCTFFVYRSSYVFEILCLFIADTDIL